VSRQGLGPASDPDAPYVRLAVVGLIGRPEDSEGTTEAVAPAVGSGGRAEQRWLLLRRAGAIECWDPPGGRLERFEDLAEGARREVKEETGLSVVATGPCYAYLTYHKGERLVAVSMACRIESQGRDPDSLRLEPGVTEWGWKTQKEWEELAKSGLTSWSAQDVRRATLMALELWEAERS
jgi:8-oxo-dGTP pyrophosphatase MutT (NUDIX family)